MQGHYTIPFGGDRNLCRSYMPFDCRHYRTGEYYDYKTVEGRSRWNEKNGEVSAWLTEDGSPWKPTDVHLASTLKALPLMGIDPSTLTEKELASWRGKGKMFNFSRNYGVGDETAAISLDITIEQASSLNKGYSEAFPKVVDYQEAVSKRMHQRGYAVNIRGRRYYLDQARKFYKVGNYIIQGSCADILKECMINIDRFLTKNQCKSKMILCVHDELQFEVPKEEDWIIPEIKRMMEDTPDVLVPIIADVELTETNWAEKFEIHL